MPKFVALINFTEAGVRAIEETTRRSEAFRAKAEALGVTVELILWTMGGYDGVLVFDAPDGETAAGLMLSLGKAGNVRTQTLRAWDREGIEAVLAKAV